MCMRPANDRWRTALAIAALCAGCAREAVRTEADSVMSRTTPRGSARPVLSPPTRQGLAVEYTWALRVATPWPAYARWATDRLAPAFTCHQFPRVVECVRRTTGDSFVVRLSVPDPDDPHHVAGVFTARPH